LSARASPGYGDIAAELAATGLAARGGFHPSADDYVPDAGLGLPTRTLVLVGNVGPDLWPYFAKHADRHPNALDVWTREIIEPIAARFGARSAFPFDRPFLPFQRWAMRAEPVHSSPLGILIHPEHGLWHAYRAALLFSGMIELPSRDDRPNPCDTCAGNPCLSACPVGAFSGAGYDVPACASHLGSPEGIECLDGGCRARDACPVAADRKYSPDQIRFHMAAFRRSVCA
jgi:ferredoxin